MLRVETLRSLANTSPNILREAEPTEINSHSHELRRGSPRRQAAVPAGRVGAAITPAPWRVSSEPEEAEGGLRSRCPRRGARAPARGDRRWDAAGCASQAGGNGCGARTAPESRRLQHGVGAQLSALPGALLLSALLTFPPALRSHQAAEELRGQHCRGAPARAPLAAPGALGLLPRARGVTGAARTLAGGHGAVRAPSWVSASILRPPGFEGQARLPRWQMLFPRFMPSQVLEPSCCPGLGGVEDRGCSYSR
ncbi:small integral membrane protein 43 isoform X1 [Kogia breviceps]|uniref:small integral membrane protein 43 isoform X1 n=1 Tax=Kogia breviceps TaxID=27615 RepID=UPI0034D23344